MWKKMYPTCKCVLKCICGKINSRNENGQKACLILAACNCKTLKVFKVYSSCDNNDDSLNHSSISPVASDLVHSWSCY